MKRCPECRRDYTDETLNYCLDDGATLLDGPASGDAAKTAILSVHETEPATLVFERPTGRERTTPAKTKLLIAALLVTLVASGFGVYRYALRDRNKTESFKSIRLTRVTAEGAVESAAVSPDGKYIAYSLEESGKRSLWTKHLATQSRVQIVPATESISMHASAFSPDGGYVYYTRQDDEHPKGALYSVPVLGGTPKKIVDEVSQPVSVSRDGKRIMFGRYKQTNTDDLLFIADADGTNEKLLTTVREPDYLQGSAAAWSPDGAKVAIGYGKLISGEGATSPVYKMNVAVLPLDDPQFKLVTSDNWSNVESMAWLSDGSGLVFVAGESRSGSRQLWQCAYPSGETRRVTNDLNSYDSVSMTADDTGIITIQKHPVSEIWVAPEGDTARAGQVPTRRNVQSGRTGLGWTPDGRIVYDSSAGTNSTIWSTNPDGTDSKQLTDGSTDDFAPEVSPDGRHIVFGALRNGFQVWRMDIDGANARQITAGTGIPTFAYSPDGQWITANPYLGGILKIPVEGGDAISIVAEGAFIYPQVSPGGDLVAYLVSDKITKRPKINVIRFDGGEQVKTFDLPVSAMPNYFETLSYRGFHWSPDGQGLVYINTIGGVSNLWRQPLSGGPATQITEFKTDRIYTFAYSRDGKTLAFARGSDTPDAVLITDVK
ncbi:MAG TPA: hypothetical protein VJV05_08110 [Pyrinomonadaceae bacterium]|nr:hypothetical protein [Pyrinomonadaceae bacterium]